MVWLGIVIMLAVAVLPKLSRQGTKCYQLKLEAKVVREYWMCQTTHSSTQPQVKERYNCHTIASRTVQENVILALLRG